VLAVSQAPPLQGEGFLTSYHTIKVFVFGTATEPLTRKNPGGSGRITAAFSRLFLSVSAQVQHPGSEHWLEDLAQATGSDSGVVAHQRKTEGSAYSPLGCW
jgi:hypothetical protein